MTSSPATARPGVYRGNRSLAEELTHMLTIGKRVHMEERNRWRINRAFYMGDQYLQVVEGVGVRTQAPASRLRSGRRRDTVNRLRQFVDGRVAMFTRETPPYEVIPENMDHDEYQSARVAERFLASQWRNTDGWNIHAFRRSLVLKAEQDGLVFANVEYDVDGGPRTTQDIPHAPDPQTGQWVPVTDRARLEALRAEDPDGQVLWRNLKAPMGDVRFRTVRVSKIAVDPDVTDDWRRCRWVIESDMWPVERLERRAGKRLEELRDESRGVAAQVTSTIPGTAEIEDGYRDQRVSGSNTVMVHRAVIAPQGPGTDWPDGGHILWTDIAPGAPFVVEKWDRPVPYFPFTPRPDGMHLLRSRGTTDDLRPLQIMLNRTVSAIGGWLDKLAWPPLLLNGGSIRSNTPVFNEEGVLILNPGFSDPHFMQVGAEPIGAMTGWTGWILEQMAEISIQNDVTRGTPPGQGVQAGVALQELGQNNEVQLSTPEDELQKTTEWAVNEAFRLVGKHFELERTVTLPGTNGQDEVISIRGEHFRANLRFRITGSTMPRSKEARRRALMEAAAASGGRIDLSRYVTDLAEGDVDAVTRRLRMQADRQANENRQILALGRHPLRDQIWDAFVKQRDMYLQMANAAAQDANVADPVAFLRQQGFPPPRVTDMMKKVSAEARTARQDLMRIPGLVGSDSQAWPSPVDVPAVGEFDDPIEHIQCLDEICLADGYPHYHDLVKQVIREHREDHLAKTTQTQGPGAEMPDAMGAGGGMAADQPVGPPAAPGPQPPAPGPGPQPEPDAPPATPAPGGVDPTVQELIGALASSVPAGAEPQDPGMGLVPYTPPIAPDPPAAPLANVVIENLSFDVNVDASTDPAEVTVLVDGKTRATRRVITLPDGQTATVDDINPDEPTEFQTP